MKSLIGSACAAMVGLAFGTAPQVSQAGVVGEYIHTCGAVPVESLSAPIAAAGNDWVAVDTLDAATLQGLDALVIRYCGTYPGNEAVNAAVAEGMGLVLDTSNVVAANLPSAPGVVFSDWCHMDFSIAPGAPITTGAGGTLTNDSLDVGGPGGMGGYCSFTGTASIATLPTGAIPFVTTPEGLTVGAFGYNSGAGRVALSESQFSHSSVFTPSEYLYAGSKTYYVNALMWTLGMQQPTTCASEGYAGTKLTWCQNICEKGYTGATLSTWIRRWTDRYRELPYCAASASQPAVR
jgi:hypothetical protein